MTGNDRRVRIARILFALAAAFVAVLVVTPVASLLVGLPEPDGRTAIAALSSNARPYAAGDVIAVVVHDDRGGDAGRLVVGEAKPRLEDVLALARDLRGEGAVTLREGRVVLDRSEPESARLEIVDAPGNAGATDFAAPAHDRAARSEVLRKAAHFALSLGFLLGLALPALRRGSRRALEESGLRESRVVARWLTGFAVGAGGLLAYVVLLTLVGQRRWDVDADGMLGSALGYGIGAIAIGLLEDVTFFGFFYALVGGRVVPTALFYAATHFLHMPKTVDFGTEALATGPLALEEIFRALGGIAEDPVQLCGLATVGLVLAGLRRVSGSVLLGMGLHGGWYFARGFGRRLSDDLDTDLDWLFGSNLYYDGLLGFFVLGATGILLARVVGRRPAAKK